MENRETLLKGNFLSCFLFAFTLTGVLSCEKSSTFLKQDPENSLRAGVNITGSIEQQLKIVAKKLVWIPRNTVARKIIYAKIDEKFDGDDNVLVEDLLQAFKSSNVDFVEESSLDKSTTVEQFNQCLDDFKSGKFSYEKGKSYYPQIYIPNYEDLKEKKLLGVSRPVLVFHSGDESSNLIDGFATDTEGNMTKIPYKINEDYSKSHEVWVISINEAVHSQSDIDRVKKETLAKRKKKGARAFAVYPGNAYSDCNDLPLNQAPNFGPYGIRMTIPSYSPKIHKEPWYAGRLEIYVDYTSAWGNGYTQYAPYGSYQTSGTRNTSTIWNQIPNESQQYSTLLGFVPRSDVGQYYQVATENPYFYDYYSANVSGWGRQGEFRRDCIYYVIYEQDNSSRKSVNIVSDSFDPNDTAKNSVSISFESEDNPFIQGYFYWYINVNNNLCNTSVIAPDMSFVITATYAPN